MSTPSIKTKSVSTMNIRSVHKSEQRRTEEKLIPSPSHETDATNLSQNSVEISLQNFKTIRTVDYYRASIYAARFAIQLHDSKAA